MAGATRRDSGRLLTGWGPAAPSPAEVAGLPGCPFTSWPALARDSRLSGRAGPTSPGRQHAG
jgi:hypothetical protein